MCCSSGAHVPRLVFLDHWRPILALFSAGVLLPIVRGDLVAQSEAVAGPGDTTLAVRLQTITTDTGAFAPGHRDFTHYTTPDMCLAAAELTRAHALVTLQVQALQINDLDKNHDLLADTSGLGAAASVARACGARFTRTSVPPNNLTPDGLTTLFELAMYQQNDTLAQRALALLLTHQHSFQDSLGIYDYGLDHYLKTGKTAMAKALVGQVDVPGAKASQRYMAMLLLGRWMSRYWSDRAHHSSYRPIVDRQIQLYWSLPRNLQATSNEIAWFAIDWAWHWLVQIELEQGVPVDSMYAIARIQKQVIDGMDDTLRQRMLRDHHAEVTKDRTLDGLMFGFEPLIPSWASYKNNVGGIAPRLTATYWYPPHGRPASDTIRPTPKKVNVMCLGGILTNGYGFNINGANNAYETAYEMRRWLAKYGPDNLEATIVRPAKGYDFLAYNPEYSGLLYRPTVQSEAQAWRWYVQDYQQLPVTVAVQARPVQWHPAPDGRRASEGRVQFAEFFEKQLDPNKGSYGVRWDMPMNHAIPGKGSYVDNLDQEYQGKTACVVIDRSGQIVYASDDDNNFYNTDQALLAVFRDEGSQGEAR